MKIQELKYNLFLVDFKDVESDIQKQLKKELEKYGILTYDSLPRKDYLQLIRYFSLLTICKHYRSLEHKRNTIFYINEKETSEDILNFVKEIKKYFPLLLYITTEQYNLKDTAVQTEITLKLKEFRYSLDYSKYSFNKIKKFCKKNKLENLIEDFKL